jgi:hypothetical protein
MVCHSIFRIIAKKMERFGMLGGIRLQAKMPHRQMLWPVAADAKLWFEAQKMARILRVFCADQRSREILR